MNSDSILIYKALNEGQVYPKTFVEYTNRNLGEYYLHWTGHGGDYILVEKLTSNELLNKLVKYNKELKKIKELKLKENNVNNS